MDLGGSSTQLIFFNGTTDSRKVHANDFWSYSWLSFGAHKVQERVLQHIVNTHLSQLEQQSTASTLQCSSSNSTNTETNEEQSSQCSLESESTTNIIVVSNPCDFVGHRQQVNGVELLGTGHGRDCFDMIQSVIWPSINNSNSECLKGRPCPIEEIEHPSVRGHHFYAMSVYFFALDCMREIGPVHLTHW